jgi:hypothetical protein
MKISPAPIECLEKNNTVYVRNLKCASTFFYQNFIQDDWHPIKFESIDWDCHVFGHILDPIERRYKGIAEYIKMCNLEQEYLESEKLQKLIKSAPFLDRHSTPYHLLFENKIHSIDWIPLSKDYQQNIKCTEILLQNDNINPPTWNYSLVHSSNTGKIIAQLEKDFTYYDAIMYEKQAWEEWYCSRYVAGWPELTDFASLPEDVKKEIEIMHANDFFYVQNDKLVFNLGTVPTDYITQAEMRIWESDIELYKEIIKKFNPNANNWREISWLR